MEHTPEVCASMVEVEPFVLMDNGTRFYLHVIGITPLSRQTRHSADEPTPAKVV